MEGLKRTAPGHEGTGHRDEQARRASLKTHDSTTGDTRNAALAYARHGFAVIPVDGKKPLIRDWPTRATTDAGTISEWWTRWPHAGVAVATGAHSGVLVLDLDAPEAVAHVAEIGLPVTPVARTPRGWHVYMRFPHGFAHSTTRANVLAVPGGDVRGSGGFIVAPPSPHPEGVYEWKRSPWDYPLADAPDWLLDALTPAQTAQTHGPAPEVRCADRYALAALHGECTELASTSAGGRNHRLNAAAFKLARFVTSGTLSADDVTASLTDAAIRAGLPQHEIPPTLGSGLRAGLEVHTNG